VVSTFKELERCANIQALTQDIFTKHVHSACPDLFEDHCENESWFLLPFRKCPDYVLQKPGRQVDKLGYGTMRAHPCSCLIFRGF
jgi:hypothetical protein